MRRGLTLDEITDLPYAPKSLQRMRLAQTLAEIERLRAIADRWVPTSDQHDTGCMLHPMHDDFYENPDPDEHPPLPRVCECHVKDREWLDASD